MSIFCLLELTVRMKGRKSLMSFILVCSLVLTYPSVVFTFWEKILTSKDHLICGFKRTKILFRNLLESIAYCLSNKRYCF